MWKVPEKRIDPKSHGLQYTRQFVVNEDSGVPRVAVKHQVSVLLDVGQRREGKVRPVPGDVALLDQDDLDALERIERKLLRSALVRLGLEEVEE